MPKPTLTERHLMLNQIARGDSESWQVGSNGSGARHWFVLREPYGKPVEYHEDKNGDLIRYTEAGALKKAEELNAKRAEEHNTKEHTDEDPNRP